MISQDVLKCIEDYSKLRDLLAHTNAEVSKYDKELSDCYHKIEKTEIKHVATSHSLIKELKVILAKRRRAKMDYHSLSTLVLHVGDRMDKAKSTVCSHIKKYESLTKNI